MCEFSATYSFQGRGGGWSLSSTIRTYIHTYIYTYGQFRLSNVPIPTNCMEEEGVLPLCLSDWGKNHEITDFRVHRFVKAVKNALVFTPSQEIIK